MVEYHDRCVEYSSTLESQQDMHIEEGFHLLLYAYAMLNAYQLCLKRNRCHSAECLYPG